MKTHAQQTTSVQERIYKALESGLYVKVHRSLQRLKPVDIALILESSPTHNRKIIWSLVDPQQQGAILEELSEDLIEGLALEMPPEQLAQILHTVETDDLAYILRNLPESFSKQLLDEFDSADRARAEKALSYEENTAGALMNPKVVTVLAHMTVGEVLTALRKKKELPKNIDVLYVIEPDETLVGEITLITLITADDDQKVRDITQKQTQTLTEKQKRREVGALFARHDLISAPVVDEANCLLGRITVDDVVDLVRDETEHDMMGMAKMDDVNTFSPTWISVQRRGIWLGVNMIAAFAAASVSNMFEQTLSQLATLAILMTIVPSMGGIAGNQTLALIIRGIALGHISSANTRWLILKETGVGAINGLIWACCIATIVYFWKGSLSISLVIGAAMLLNLTFAGLAGALAPLLLRRLGIDPALAGSMALTTITDIVGLLSFLGLATWFVL